MKRQAIGISLNDLEKLREEIVEELKDIQKLNITEKDNEFNIKVLMPIINLETVKGDTGKAEYCSDTWQFEFMRKKSGRG